MGQFGETPEVEDLTEESSDGPRYQAAIVAGVALVLVLVVMVVLSPGTEESVPASTSLAVLAPPLTTGPPPSAATSTPSTVPTVEVTALPLRDVLPGFEGTLMAAGANRLLRWPYLVPARFTDVSGFWQGSLEFDDSGQQMAFLASSASTDAALYVGRTDRWAPARIGVGSFRWHATVPGRIGWFERGDEPLLCSADVDLDDGLTVPVCVPAAADGSLVGFDDSGFLLADGFSRSVLRLGAAGDVVTAVTGVDAIIGPDGRVLVIDRDSDARETAFTVTTPNLSEAATLDWAPVNATGEIAFVAWSPSASGPDLAFITYEGRSGRLELWTLSGDLVETVDLAGRVWNVEWDSTGRYILVPGIIDETDKVLYVYDTYDSTLLTLQFDEFIADALMVTPAACDNAEHVTDVLAGKLPTGVTLTTARMVLSRDIRLESWYFISARVVGGAFDGELATWAHPGFDGRSVDDVNTPNLVVPINPTAAQFPFGMALSPGDYGGDWYAIDDAAMSEYCVRQAENE